MFVRCEPNGNTSHSKNGIVNLPYFALFMCGTCVRKLFLRQHPLGFAYVGRQCNAYWRAYAIIHMYMDIRFQVFAHGSIVERCLLTGRKLSEFGAHYGNRLVIYGLKYCITCRPCRPGERWGVNGLPASNGTLKRGFGFVYCDPTNLCRHI